MMNLSTNENIPTDYTSAIKISKKIKYVFCKLKYAYHELGKNRQIYKDIGIWSYPGIG